MIYPTYWIIIFLLFQLTTLEPTIELTSPNVDVSRSPITISTTTSSPSLTTTEDPIPFTTEDLFSGKSIFFLNVLREILCYCSKSKILFPCPTGSTPQDTKKNHFHCNNLIFINHFVLFCVGTHGMEHGKEIIFCWNCITICFPCLLSLMVHNYIIKTGTVKSLWNVEYPSNRALQSRLEHIRLQIVKG